LALKAGDRETARIILEEEISEENKEAVIRYLNSLGFVPPTVKVRKRTENVVFPKVVVEKSVHRLRKPLDLKVVPSSPPKPHEAPRSQFALTKINVRELTLSLIELAENEVLLASERVPKSVLKALKRKLEDGVEVKLLLSSSDCRAMKFWNASSLNCRAKALGVGTLLRSVPAVVAYLLPAAPPGLWDPLSLLGIPIGLSSPATLALSIMEVLFWKGSMSYTFIPWVLRLATVVSFAELLISEARARGLRFDNLEIKVSDVLPITLLIVDGRRGFSSECPLSSSSPCLASVYYGDVSGLSREFSLLWEGAQPLR